MRALTLCLLIFLSYSGFAAKHKTDALAPFLGGETVETLPDWFKASFLDFADDLEEAADANKHVMIYFHQNGCPYCAKLVAENFHDNGLVSKLKQHFDTIEINMWGDRELTDWQGRAFTEKQFAALMKVQFTPTLLFLGSEGKLLLRLNGYQSIAKMHKALDYITHKKYRQQTFANYLNKQQKKRGSLLNKNALFEVPPHLLFRNKTVPSQRYLAVFFEQPNCSSCDVFHQTLMPLAQTKKLLKSMQVVQLNALSDEKIITPSGEKTTAKKWYESLKLTDKPAIVFFDKSGGEIIRKDAFFKTFHFHGILTYVLSGAFKTQPNFQHYLSDKSTKLRKQGITVDIWK